MANRRSGGNPLLLPMVLVIVLAGALVAVMLTKEQQTRAVAETEDEVVPSPFDDLPEETPPEPTAGSGAGSTGLADAQAPDLTDNPYARDETFQDQLEKAERAEALFQQAVAALEDSDRKTFQQKGYEARQLFEKVIEETAAFEEALIAEHGDTDEQVRAILRTRGFWEDRRLFLHELAY